MSGKELGEICKCDHTQASRIASGQRGATVEEWCDLLEGMGFKVVPSEFKCVSAERLRFLESTTARVLANEQISAALWEEPV